jgi:hypothetical protein
VVLVRWKISQKDFDLFIVERQAFRLHAITKARNTNRESAGWGVLEFCHAGFSDCRDDCRLSCCSNRASGVKV